MSRPLTHLRRARSIPMRIIVRKALKLSKLVRPLSVTAGGFRELGGWCIRLYPAYVLALFRTVARFPLSVHK